MVLKSAIDSYLILCFGAKIRKDMYKGVYITQKCFFLMKTTLRVSTLQLKNQVAVNGTLIELGSCLLLALMTHVYGSIKVRH